MHLLMGLVGLVVLSWGVGRCVEAIIVVERAEVFDHSFLYVFDRDYPVPVTVVHSEV
jgi:hypothetical protein